MRIALVACAAGLAGCGDGRDAGAPDAAITDAGPCGDGRLFIAELLDWDSRVTAFHSIGSARWTVDGMPDMTIVTTPHGVVELCVPDASVVELTVDNPMRYLDGPAIITRAALDSGQSDLLSLRALTPARALTFYAEHALAYEPTRAHVLVYSAGARASLALDRAHAAAQAGNEDGGGTLHWHDGTAGRFVLFPNVDASQPTATLALPGGERLVVPLVANELTLAAVYY